MKRILYSLIFIFSATISIAQSYGDGCMRVRFVATQAYCEEYEDPFANDESNWQWWFADAGNYDGAGWLGGQCLAQGGFYMIGWWNHNDFTVYDYTYGVAGPIGVQVPQTYSLRGHYEGDDCGGSCDYCTSNPFDNDDYRFDEVVSSGINYRFSAPNQDNYFTLQTSWHGGSDYGGQFYVNYSSPRPLVTASTNQICSGTTTSVTLNFSGAIFGGSYVVYDGATIIYNGTTASTTVSINSSKTYNVYTRNNGVNSLCYSTININAINCNFNCVTKANVPWSASYDASQGFSSSTSYTSPGNFPSNSYISDINVDINFLKTDGSCASPAIGSAFHNETNFRLNNSTLGSISLVEGNFTGNTALTTPITISFDEDAGTSVSGYNVLPSSNGADLNPIGNLDAWNWNIIDPTQTWNLWGGDAVALDPLCTNFYNLTVCGCKTADFGTAFVNGSSLPITICASDPGTITLSHNGSTSGFDNEGYGDELRWFSGSCGGVFVGSGLSISIPSPTVTTTYYASYYIDGQPCRGANSFCKSITVNVTPVTVPGTISPASQTICVSTSPSNLTLSGHTGIIYQWQYLDNNTGNWSIAAGSGASTSLSLVPYASIPGTHTFRAMVFNGVCDTLPSTTAVLIVNPNPNAGALSAVQTTVCSDSAYVLNANGYAGNIQWQESSINGTTGFTDIIGANSPSYGNTISNTGSSVINRWYRIVVTNPPCVSSAISNVIQISVSPITDPGILVGTKDSICQGDDAGTITLNSYIGTITSWLSSFNNGTLTPISNTNNTYMPGTLSTAGTYDYYAIVQSGTCNPDTSLAYRVTVLPTLTASISGPIEVCAGISITLTATVTGGSGTYSYQWQRNGANVGSNSSTYTTSTALTPNNYNYTVIVTSAQCQVTSAVHAVTVNPQPTISNVTSQNLDCYGVNIGSINITAIADSFSIDNGTTFTTSNTFSSLPAGNYNVVVKNNFGCLRAYSGNPVVITQPDSTSIHFNITEPHCSTSGDGSVTILATGGTPGYEYALNGGAYQSGSTFSNLAPGTYTFSVRDNNNCVYSKDTTLTAQYTFDVVIDSFKNVSCPGSADGYVQLGTNGGVSPYQFSTDNAIFSPDSIFTGLVAGSYTFYAEDMNGCTDVVSANIVETPPVQISLDSVIQISCNNANDGAIFVSVTGSTPPYSYDWKLNGTTISNIEDITGLAPGSYNLTVNTTASCLATLSVTLVSPDSIIATVTNTTDVSCNAATDGSVSVSITGGTPNYTYSWLDGTSTQVATTQNLSNVGADSYSLTVTDANGCTATANATVNEPAALSVVTVTSDPSCSNSNDGSITVNVTGGTAAYTYSLNSGATQSSNVFSNLAAGTYTIDVEDANGCTATGNAILSNQYTMSLAVASQTNVSCSGNNDGTVTLQATGGSGTINYTVNGTNAQTSNVFTGLAAGLYTFEATDANGCSASVSATITSNPPVVLSLDSTENVSCNGQTTGAVYVHATGGATPYSYSLNGGAGQANGMFTNLAAGSYNVVVTDNAGCTASVSTSLTEPSAFTATVTNTTDVSCNAATDGSVSVSITGGTPNYTYSWLDGTSTQVATTQNLSNVGADSYSLTVTDANGCTATANATVNEPAALSVVTVTSDPSCSNSNDGSITVNVTGGTAAYTYSLNSGATQSSNVFSNLAAGTYTIDVEDANGCTATGNAILSNQYTMSLAVASQTNVSCSGNNDGTVTLQATGGSGTINYTVNGTNAQTSNVFTGLAVGLYTFEATDANGCSASVSATITSNPPVVLSLDSTENVSCNGQTTGAVYVHATGGATPYSYSLNGGAGQANGMFTNLAAGSYNVVVTDNAGCTASVSTSLTEPSAFTATVTNTTDVSCNAATDGSVSVSITGGTPNYTYSWLDGTSTQVATTQNLSNVGADSYSLTVTDANGCTATANATVNEPAALSVVTVTSDPSCSNSNDGSITVNVTGGTAAYTYSLNSGATQSSNVFSNLAAGTYTIDVEDANGCTATGNAILSNQYTMSLAVASQTNVSCSGNNDGTVTLQATGGSGTINYTVNGTNAQTSNVFTGLAAGLYTFEATDANGCSASVSATITSNPPVVLSLDSTENVSCNGQTTGAVYVHATGGATPYSYSLNGGAGQANGMFTNLAAGSYNVVVTDNAGCTASVSTSLTEPSAFTATVTNTTDVSCNAATDGSVSVSITGGTPNYTCGWLDGTSTQVATTQNLSNVGADSYSLTVTDANGCTATANATVNEPAALSVVTVTSDPSCSNSNDGSITVNVTGGTAAYTYSLNSGATQSSNVFSNLAAGTYTIDVEDANGCTATGNAILSNQYTMSLAVASQTNVSCSGNNDGTVTLQATGGSGTINYTVNGTNAQTSNVFTGLAAGLYTFEATDANGCSASVSATITSNPPVVLTLDSTENVSCNGQTTGAVYVHATGGATPYSYSLNGGAGQANGMFTNLAAGSYNVVVTDNAGCTASVSTSLTEPSAFTATVTNTTDVSCNGATDGSVSVSVTGGTPNYTYSWLDGTSTQVATTQNLSNVGADSYSLTVTDANGCTATANATVNEPVALSVVTVTSDPSCSNSNDGSITVNVTGGTAAYSYSLNSGATQSSNVFSNLAAGTYTIDVEDANGCTATGNAILSNQYTMSLAVASQTNVSCSGNNDGTVTLQATGGSGTINYTVNGTNAQTSNVFTGLAAGLYTFEATDANGCSASVSATITENPPLILNLDNITNVNCNGQNTGSITVSATGGASPYSFTLNGGAAQNSGTFANLVAGTYTVAVIDNNGCSQSLSATITQPGALSLVVADYSNINCANDSSGHVDVSVAGGVPPYNFSWSNGATTEDIYNLPIGTYTITVTDANGCIQTISQTISNPSPLLASISTTDELCFGDNQGTATVTASGGTAPYTYLWNNFATTQTISGLSAGIVSVMVTDKNGCQIVVSDTVYGPSAALEIVLDRISHVSCYGGNDGEILTSIFGGTAPYTVSWTPNVSNSQNADSLMAGAYILTVTDANGCQTSSTFVVQQPPQIVSSVSVTNPSCFGQETGMALVGASGGTLPFTYEWNTTPIQTGALANNLAGDTTYIVQITDNNGCVAYDTAVTIYPGQMTVSTSAQGVTCVSNVNGEVAVQVQGGQAPYTYQLNGFMQTDSVFDNLAVGTYVVFVVDNNNCSASTQFDIVNLPVLEIDLQGAGINSNYYSDELQIVRGEEVSLLVDLVNGGVGIQSVHWLPNSGPFAVDTTCTNPPCLEASIMPDTYVQVVVNVVDTNGCMVYDTLNINVSQEPLFFMPTAFSPNADCLNDNFEINILGATNLDVKVYNRWGEQLFHNANQENGLNNPDDIINECLGGSLNPRNAWDGTFNGEPMPNGAYVYQIDATMFDGTTQTINGTITIIR